MDQFSEMNPNPVISVVKDWTVLYSNEAGEPILHEWGVAVGEKLPSYIGEFVQKVISRNNPEKIKVNVGKRIYLITFHPFPEEKCVNIYGFDISDRKEFDRKIREGEGKYCSILESTDECIWIIDADGRTNYINEKMAGTLGYSQEEIAGKFAWDFTDEKGKAILELNLGKRRHGINETHNETHEFKLIRKGGSPLWMLINSKSLFDEDNKFTGFMGTLTDITERKRIEKAMNPSGQNAGPKLESILSPAREIANLELVDIIDIQAIKSLMEDFYKLVHITMALVDLKGNVLLAAGWQDICTKFHRVHPETCKHCMESDTKLSSGVSQGEYKLYKCKNNMWDIATPIVVGGQHVGNAFSGQFFFEGEPLDYELFRSNARKYGFNEKEYIAALEKVPKLSPESVNTGMSFLMTFANMVSQLGYSNLKLARSLAERDTLVEALRKSEEQFRSVLENSLDVAYRRNLQTDSYDYMSPVVEKITGFSAQEMSAMSINESIDRIHPDDRLLVTKGLVQAFDTGFGTLEYRFEHKDGKYRWFADHFRVIKDQNGSPLFSGGIVRDITGRRKADEVFKKVHESLERLVEERTAELEEAYKSLKESEKGLAEAQKMAHIGNWRWDRATDKAYWSDELYRIFGRDPQEEGANYNEFLSYLHPDDRDYMDNAHQKALNGIPYDIEYRIILANGEERTVHMQSEVIFDEKNAPVRLKGIAQDITERKEAEEALANLEIARKKEIHHRIKNNLQVISSLLDIQADKFDDPRVIEAFRESQNRVISMAIIHEKLYKGEGTDTLDFSSYIRELAENLFQTYSLKSENIHLCMDLEESAFFNMDVAVPLGIIVNELVSNSLKYAFPGGNPGEIQIKLLREKVQDQLNNRKERIKGTKYTLIVSDNGIGIPERFDLENSDTLGLQLVYTLVDQLDGEIELKRDRGTKFDITIAI